MLPPELIERIKKEREERDRPCLQIPLYPPEDSPSNRRIEDEETTQTSRVIVIEL